MRRFTGRKRRVLRTESLETRQLLAGNPTAYPDDGGLIEVASFGAFPDDGIDDTAAIQAALDAADAQASNLVVYLAPGRYDVSETLQWPPRFRRLILEGSGSEHTTIRLADQLPGYSDPTNPKAVINTHGRDGVGQGFRNSIRGLTVDVGIGNAGAMGVAFNANNQGSIRDVSIVSSDPNGLGARGLDLSQNGQIGPFYIDALSVEGFDYGIFDQRGSRSITAVDVSLKDQRIAGLFNDGQVWNLEGFESSNTVPAIVSQGSRAILNVIDAELKTQPASDGLFEPAIVGQQSIYLRDVTVSGSEVIVADPAGDGVNVLTVSEVGSFVHEWSATGGQSIFPSTIDGSLNLRRLPEPELPLDADLSRWANPLDYGAVGDGLADDTAAIQAAIDDSTKSTVYLPGGNAFRIEGRLELRGNIERLIGLESRVTGDGEIAIVDGSSETVFIERLDNRESQSSDRVRIRQATQRTVVLSSLSGFRFDQLATGASELGDLFLTDVVGSPFRFEVPDQRVFARQLNVEIQETNIDNAGADLFVLGLKTEKEGVKILSRDGARTELIGAHILSNNPWDQAAPLFRVEDAQATFVGVRNVPNSTQDDPYLILLEETRGESTRQFLRSDNPTGGVLGLLSANDGLVGHWAFEEDGGDSVGQNHGTLIDVELVPGAIDVGGEFSHSSVLDVNPVDQPLETLDAFTVTGWLRTHQRGRPTGVLDLSTHVDDQPGDLAILMRGGQLEAHLPQLLGEHRFRAGVEIDDGTWHHFALTVDAGDALHWYIDGQRTDSSVAVEIDQQALLGLQRLLIGQSFNGNGEQLSFRGQLDAFRIFDRALSSEEVRARFAEESPLVPLADCGQPLPNPTDDVLAEWSLDGDVDDGQNRFTGFGDAVDFEEGVEGLAASLDHQSSIDLETSDLELCEFTLSGWVRTDSTSRRGIFHLRSGDGDDYRRGGWAVYLSGGELVFESEDLIGSQRFRSHRELADGQWHSFAITVRPGERIDWYIDGEESPSATIESVGRFEFRGLDRGAIGGRFFHGESRLPFAGELDEFRLFDRALSGAEIRTNLATGSSAGSILATFDDSDDEQEPIESGTISLF
ncbi:MAG: LamG-like jellyroll fold domain-containing protein [Planctomycetota bacterium]